MSFSRIKYDNEAYNLRINRSGGPGDYRLFLAGNESCTKCLSYNGARNGKSDVSIAENETTNQWSSMAEVESHLTNRINKLVDSNIYGKNDNYKNLQTVNKTFCNNNELITEDTRFTNPIEAYRCMDVTPYHYTPFLYVKSQCEIQQDRIGLNSRLNIKDNFVINKPNLIDQSVFFPKSTDGLLNVDVCKN